MSDIENIQRDLNQIKKTYQQKFLHWTDEFVMENSKERVHGLQVALNDWSEKEKAEGPQHVNSPPGHTWDFELPAEIKVKVPSQIDLKSYVEETFYDELIDKIKENPKKPPMTIHKHSQDCECPICLLKEQKGLGEVVFDAGGEVVFEHQSFCTCPACVVKEQKGLQSELNKWADKEKVEGPRPRRSYDVNAVKDQAILQIEQLDIRPGDRLLITLNPRPNGQNYSASSILKINKELEKWAGIPVKLIYADVINKITIIRDEDDSDEWCPDRD